MGIPASDLPEAAGLAYDNLFTNWQLGPQFYVAMISFAGDLGDLFPDENVNARPIMNWALKMAAFATLIFPDVSNEKLEELNEAAGLVYRACWVAQHLADQGLITAPQAAAVLLSYNNSIAV
jgi:hypothetical protein